jgi:ribosomal peptide maturation radical SAM protein 1
VTADAGILLVCMPFGHAFSPSIGLSLLKSELAERGLAASVRYFSLRFADLVGWHLYHQIALETRPSIEDLAGEWIFSRALFGPGDRDNDYVDRILRRGATWTTNRASPPASGPLIDRILRARARAEGFLDRCLDEVLQARPRLVGFTSMFQQHVASLALARRIKESRPDVFIVFGGANCEGAMGAETVRQFPFVDAAVSGEADLLFPALARRVLDGQSIAGLAGVRTRAGVDEEFARGRFSSAPMVRDLDALPYPDYTDFFAQFEASRMGAYVPSVLLETSRGCWWGEKMHCTFCGLNGQTMAFRSKSPQRAMDELAWLAHRHPGSDVQVTDNILDMRYFKDLLPALAKRPGGPELFYEVKANLTKEQLRLLRDARVTHIQPGIESLSDSVLKLMRKGVSALQNIQLLKWCKELGIDAAWNILWGFPGEPPEEYERMATLLPLLAHLRPPDGGGIIRLDRFSPNFDDAEGLGFEDVTPLPPYRHVYPLSSEALANLAYFFTFEYREPREVGSYVGPLRNEIRRWRRRWPRYDLFSVDTGDGLLIWDLRPVRTALLTVLRGVDRVLYQACDRASDLRRLGECLPHGLGRGPLLDMVEERLAPLLARGLLLRDGARYLALAVPLGVYTPPPPARERFYRLVEAAGNRTEQGWVIPAAAGGRRRRAGGGSKQGSSSVRTPDGSAGRLSTGQFSLINGGNDVLVRPADLSSSN